MFEFLSFITACIFIIVGTFCFALPFLQIRTNTFVNIAQVIAFHLTFTYFPVIDLDKTLQ